MTDLTVEAIPPDDAAPAVTEPLPKSYPFSFTGDAAEYFGIWIVNLFLSIITLGIYSAWAKVRRKRYFYGHTWVGESNFEYHGNPVSILKGRIIAVIFFIGYTAAGHFNPTIAEALLLLLFAAAPWFIVRSMAFNAYNSSYRNIRFRFRASYMDGLKAIWPLVFIPLSALLLPDIDPNNPPTDLDWKFWTAAFVPMVVALASFPYVIRNIKSLQANHSSFGSAPFSFACDAWEFYKIFLLTYLIGIGAMLAVVLSAMVLAITIIGIVLIPFVYLLAGAVVVAFERSRSINLTFLSTRLAGEMRLVSTLKVIELAKIYFVNLLVITFTMGLMIPWAAVRVARYRAECLALESSQPLDGFVAGVTQQIAATGEEMGEMFDMDLSL